RGGEEFAAPLCFIGVRDVPRPQWSPTMRLMRVATAVSVLALLSCSSDDDGTDPAAAGIAAKITAVSSSAGGAGTVKSGSVPDGSGPALTIASVLSVINGGTATVPVAGAAAFQRLAVAISGVE